jgi:hypothetical protein
LSLPYGHSSLSMNANAGDAASNKSFAAQNDFHGCLSDLSVTHV